MKNVFTTADILVPGSIPMETWSVIACDQFSSEREYWQRVRDNIGDRPSTYNLIIPEAYLKEISEEMQIKKISTAMDDYLRKGVFREVKDSFIYVERTQPDGRIRKGIVGAVDLEEYDFTGMASAIRASESTVLDRLPPRIRVRSEVSLELPHIITFIDDKDATVIEPLSERADELTLLYDFKLMEGGGRIKGRIVSDADANNVMEAMRALHEKKDILIIMGDGNHSLAAAKVYWDDLKHNLSEREKENHPARKALVELINVYDPAVSFEAIHRVLFNVNASEFISTLENATPRGTDYTVRWSSREGRGNIGIKAECIGDLLTMLQELIDRYIGETGATVDYIHGEETTLKLAEEKCCLGLVLPSMCKSDFFETVERNGIFPSKSFSVGHARDKRYYLECRKIR